MEKTTIIANLLVWLFLSLFPTNIEGKMKNIKLFNLNCWLLPTGFSSENHSRLDKIIKLIKKENPDIITLQEVWTNDSIAKIKKELKDYKIIYSKNLIFNRTGLVTGLRMPHKSHKVEFYPLSESHSPLERLARKGYQIINLDEELTLVNTHLYNPTNKREKEITKKQCKYLLDLTNRLDWKKVVIIGDFNLSRKEIYRLGGNINFGSDEYLIDISENKYIFYRGNKHKKYNDRIDYLLYNKKNDLNIRTKLLLEEKLSDHYPIIANIKRK